MLDRRQRLAAARLYLVCDEQPDRFLAAALRGGTDIVQLRMKGSSEDAILATAARFVRVCAAHGALFILNDRSDLALEAQADGVHLGQDDTPGARARALLGPDRLVGLSTHEPDQVDRARDCDYIGVGPVYATPTKPGRAPVGLDLVRYAARSAALPFFAIGGIDAGNVSLVRDAGARRIAVVRALTGAREPQSAARALRAALLAQPAIEAAQNEAGGEKRSQREPSLGHA